MNCVNVRLQPKSVVIEVDGREFAFPKHKGFVQIIDLMANPDCEISCLLLAADDIRTVWEAESRMERSRILYEPDDEPTDTYYSLTGFQQNEIMDEKYLNDMKKEANRLIRQIAVAVEYNDLALIEELKNELDELTGYLKKIMRPDGKSVNLPDEFGKPLDALRKSVNSAIKMTGEHCPELMQHLSKQIRVGRYCCYHSLPSVEVNVMMDITKTDTSAMSKETSIKSNTMPCKQKRQSRTS